MKIYRIHFFLEYTNFTLKEEICKEIVIIILYETNTGPDILGMGYLYLWSPSSHCNLLLTSLNSVYNDYVYNDIPVIAIEFHGPGLDACI